MLGGVEYAQSDGDEGDMYGDIKGLGHMIRDTIRIILHQSKPKINKDQSGC